MTSIALKPAVAVIVLAVASVSGTAMAQPTVFTQNPSASVPPLAASGAVKGDTLFVGDYTIVHLMGNGAGTNSFTESGFLPVQTVQYLGSTAPTPVNAAGGYGEYFQFTASGADVGPLPTSTNPASPLHTTNGYISAISYSLYGVPGHPATFTVNTALGTVTVSNNAGAILLASGTILNPGSVSATMTRAGLTTTADITATYTEALLQSGFFTTWDGNIGLTLEAAFTNTASVVSTAPAGSGGIYIGINGGGGNVTFGIPEPASLLTIGTGLLGLFGLRFRRRR